MVIELKISLRCCQKIGCSSSSSHYSACCATLKSSVTQLERDQWNAGRIESQFLHSQRSSLTVLQYFMNLSMVIHLVYHILPTWKMSFGQTTYSCQFKGTMTDYLTSTRIETIPGALMIVHYIRRHSSVIYSEAG